MKKTSAEWFKWCNVEIIDPDGWDRKNFDYSWNKEKITKEEFMQRTNSSSTIRSTQKRFWKDGFEIYLTEMEALYDSQSE